MKRSRTIEVVALVAAAAVSVTGCSRPTGGEDLVGDAPRTPTTPTVTSSAEATGEHAANEVEPADALAATVPGVIESGLRLTGGTTVRRDDGIDVTVGEIALDTPHGPVALVDPVVYTEPGGDTTTVSTVVFPDSGPLADAVQMLFPRGPVGVATGAELSGVPYLDDDTTYYYVVTGEGFGIETMISGAEREQALPQYLSTPGGAASIFVVDPVAGFFYAGGPCPTIPGNRRPDTRPDPSRQRDSRPGRRTPTEPPSTEEQDLDLLTIDLDPGDADVECGFGYSATAGIRKQPAVRREGATPIDAHLVVDGAGPIAPTMSLDGSMFFRLLPDETRMLADGTASLGLAAFRQGVTVELPVADAAIDATFAANRTELGIASSTVPPLRGLPGHLAALVEPPVGGGFDGLLQVVDGELGRGSYLRLQGRFRLDPFPLASAAGVDTNAIEVDGVVRLDTTGLSVTGSTAVSPIPFVTLSGDAVLDAKLAIDGSSHIALVGGIDVYGNRLAEAALSISATEVSLSGEVATPIGGVLVAGSVDRSGLSLEGRGQVRLPLGPVAEAARAARAELRQAEGELVRIDEEVERLRAEIRSGREANTASLGQAQADVRRAQADLDAVQVNIDYNDGRIAEFRRLQAETWDPFRQFELEIQIQGLQAANSAQYVYRDTAREALNVAIATLDLIQGGLELIPVDADPRIVALLAARGTAQAALDIAEAGLTLVPDEVRADLLVRLGTAGLLFDASVSACADAECVSLGATVHSDPLQICLTVVVDFCVGGDEIVRLG